MDSRSAHTKLAIGSSLAETMSHKGKILVTPRSVTREGHSSLERLSLAGHDVILGPRGRQPSEEELIQLLPSCIGYIAGIEPITRRVLEAAVNLRAISRNGTGVDSIDAAAARERNIVILRAEGANARGVAELTIGFLFALARGLTACDASLKAGGWVRPNGVELEGRTLGIIGCGRIGKTVAELAVGIGLRVIAYDALPDYNFSAGAAFKFAPTREVLEHSEFLSLHCPPTANGHALIGESEFAQLRHGAFIINTARYQLFDPEALLAALDSGRITGAALDVFDSEPPRDPRLALHPRVLATPHIGGLTRESVGRAMDAAVDNLIRELAVSR